MNYFLIAGEASGDLHGSKLIGSLKKYDTDARFRYFGGDRMQEQAEGLIKHYRDMAYMGFLEVFLHLRSITANIRLSKQAILDFKPDVVILIDYPGFNLRMAPFAKSLGIPVFYYISPKIWAWKQSRIKQIKEYVNRMFIILPFEKDFYKRHGMDVDYLGNPVLDEVVKKNANLSGREAFLKEYGLPDKPVIALLPGSRKQELRYNLPVMMQVARDYPAYQFLIAGAPSFTEKDYSPYISGTQVKVIFDHMYDVLGVSKAALVTSGTATLETALMNVPQVVVYKGNPVSYLIAKSFVKVEVISLVNLITGKAVVTELIQKDVRYDRVKDELDAILEDTTGREKILTGYRWLREILGEPGVSDRVAQHMITYLNEK